MTINERWLDRQESHTMKAASFVYFSKADALLLIDLARVGMVAKQEMKRVQDEYDQKIRPQI